MASASHTQVPPTRFHRTQISATRVPGYKHVGLVVQAIKGVEGLRMGLILHSRWYCMHVLAGPELVKNETIRVTAVFLILF